MTPIQEAIFKKIQQCYIDQVKAAKGGFNQLQAVKSFLEFTKKLPLLIPANTVWPDFIEHHFPGEGSKIPPHLATTNLHTAYYHHYKKLSLQYFYAKVQALRTVNAKYGFQVVPVYTDWRLSLSSPNQFDISDPLKPNDPHSRHLELLEENLKYFEKTMNIVNDAGLVEEYVKHSNIGELTFLLDNGVYATRNAINRAFYPNPTDSWDDEASPVSKDTPIFQLLIKNLYTQDKNSKHVKDMLFYAVAFEHPDILTGLIRYNQVNVNTRNKSEYRKEIEIPLIMAVKNNNLEIVTILLNAGAKIDLKIMIKNQRLIMHNQMR